MTSRGTRTRFDNFHKGCMKLLRDFNAKVGKENIFGSTFRNEIVRGISCNNGTESSELASYRNLIVASTVFPVATSVHSLGHNLTETQAIRLIRF
jgi:hypothetical protein